MNPDAPTLVLSEALRENAYLALPPTVRNGSSVPSPPVPPTWTPMPALLLIVSSPPLPANAEGINSNLAEAIRPEAVGTGCAGTASGGGGGVGRSNPPPHGTP